MKVTFKSILAMLFVLCIVLTSCEHGGTGGGDGTTDPGAATDDTTNGTTTGGVTEEAPKETAASEAIRTAFGKLSDATFFAANMKSEVKYVDFSSEYEEYETSYEISNDPGTGECLIELKNKELQNIITYTDGGSECFCKSFYEGYENSLYYDITKANTTFDIEKTVMYSALFEGEYMNDYAVLFIAPHVYNRLANAAARSKCELNVTGEIFTAKFELTGKDLAAIFNITEGVSSDIITFEEDSGGTIEIAISGDGFPKSIKLDCTGQHTIYDVTMNTEISYSRFNERSGIIVPAWVDEVKEEHPTTYIEERDAYYIVYGYNPLITDGLCVNLIIFTSGKPFDYFEVPTEFDGIDVTDVSLYSLEDAVTKGGAVLIPKKTGLYLPHLLPHMYEFSCDFFIDVERPDDFDLDIIYFKGEWEMSDGRPVPKK